MPFPDCPALAWEPVLRGPPHKAEVFRLHHRQYHNHHHQRLVAAAVRSLADQTWVRKFQDSPITMARDHLALKFRDWETTIAFRKRRHLFLELPVLHLRVWDRNRDLLQ
jgi:hypothetical protein